jgi:hypothetical protein
MASTSSASAAQDCWELENNVQAVDALSRYNGSRKTQ